MYIYQRKKWPQFTYDAESVLALLARVRNNQGRLFGRLSGMGFSVRAEAMLDVLSLDTLKSSEIEGRFLNPEQVRSSLARKLGVPFAGTVPSERYVEGVVEMMLNATQLFAEELTPQRLFNWHAALFPTGRSGIHPIAVARWRDNEKGPMQVVSGAMGREIVHFEAPDADLLDAEMAAFLTWFETPDTLDPVLKAGIAHFWFLTLHPFDDGNGRIARAVMDMQLARAEGSNQRFYSMSAQIMKRRDQYYHILEITQRGDLDITEWLIWFLDCLQEAVAEAESVLHKVLQKAAYWDVCLNHDVNSRQKMMLHKLWDEFYGNLTTAKWAKLTKSSPDTALRDIQDLLEKGLLEKSGAGGRSTHYVLPEKYATAN